jgi:ATP-dependent Lon protease
MEPAHASQLEAALFEMPFFPLPQVVLFPEALLPLHVFEPRYRALVSDCLASHKVFAVALITDPARPDARGNVPVAEIAGAGLIVEHHGLPDGRSTLLLHGQARVRLEELPFVPPYRRARATLLRDQPFDVDATDRAALLASATAFSGEIHKQDRRFTLRLPADATAGALADLCAHHLLVDTSVRQALLAETDPRVRVRTVTAELALQHATLLRETGGVLH